MMRSGQKVRKKMRFILKSRLYKVNRHLGRIRIKNNQNKKKLKETTQ